MIEATDEEGNIEIKEVPPMAWEAPRLVVLEKISNTQKISWNTENGMISGLS